MSCLILTLHVPVYCVINNASIRLCQPISKYTMCKCCGKPAGLFFHILFDIERELFLLQYSGENSVLASLSRRPGYQQIAEIPRFDFLKQVHVLPTCHAVLILMNKQFIICKHVSDSLAVKITSFRQGDDG